MARGFQGFVLMIETSENGTFSICHTRKVSLLNLKTCAFRIREERLTVGSNSAVAVVVSSGQEALGLFVRQDASTRGEPLQEVPAEDRHESEQRVEATLARKTGVPRALMQLKQITRALRYFVLLSCFAGSEGEALRVDP